MVPVLCLLARQPHTTTPLNQLGWLSVIPLLFVIHQHGDHITTPLNQHGWLSVIPRLFFISMVSFLLALPLHTTTLNQHIMPLLLLINIMLLLLINVDGSRVMLARTSTPIPLILLISIIRLRLSNMNDPNMLACIHIILSCITSYLLAFTSYH
eukprot:Rmarinus@m.5429